MHIEDKELEGPDLEREERTHEEAIGEHAEEELPVLGGEELRDLGMEHRSRLFEALRLILAEEHVTVSLLYLPQRETHALEALQTAVSGQDSVGEFVFAEDRRSLLEQSLAVLQQNVTYGDPEQLAELHGKFDELAGRLGELRAQLTNLEDAQEELLGEERARNKAEAGDEGDKDDQGDPPADGASTLSGPERPEEAPKPSTLGGGPERPEVAAAPSTLAGPERPEVAPGPSTLSGPERPEAAPEPSTLYGEPAPEAAKPASMVDAGDGDGAGAEAAAPKPKQPWWRKPFG